MLTWCINNFIKYNIKQLIIYFLKYVLLFVVFIRSWVLYFHSCLHAHDICVFIVISHDSFTLIFMHDSSNVHLMNTFSNFWLSYKKTSNEYDFLSNSSINAIVLHCHNQECFSRIAVVKTRGDKIEWFLNFVEFLKIFSRILANFYTSSRMSDGS